MLKRKLKDVQNASDTRGIDIQKVGVKHVEIPLNVVQKDGGNQTVAAAASITVDLPHHYKGTHMSRFIEILNRWRFQKLLSDDLEGCLKEVAKTLESKNAYITLAFKYFIDKKAPVSGLIAPMGYQCAFEGTLIDGKYDFILSARVPVTTLCPCSKEISDYGAHNQRAEVYVKVSYPSDNIIWLEDLIETIESCGSCPVYPILKREDEKYVTENAYNNPKFVEDVLRDAVSKMRSMDIINWFSVECEAFESIHSHSAWAYQKEHQ